MGQRVTRWEKRLHNGLVVLTWVAALFLITGHHKIGAALTGVFIVGMGFSLWSNHRAMNKILAEADEWKRLRMKHLRGDSPAPE